jgi:hypothetical protein
VNVTKMKSLKQRWRREEGEGGEANRGTRFEFLLTTVI